MTDGDSIYVVFVKGQCVDTSEVLRVDIEKNINASFYSLRNQTKYSFTPTINYFDTYSWDFGDGSPISHEIYLSHDYKTSEGESVKVTLTVTTINQCSEDSSQIISLPIFSDVSELNSLGIHIYPNPIDHTLHLEHKLGRDFKLVIRTMEGKFIQENIINKVNNQIDLNHLKTGIYILDIIDKNQHWSTTILKR